MVDFCVVCLNILICLCLLFCLLTSEIKKIKILLSFLGKNLHQCRSDNSVTTDHGLHNTHSLGHKGAPLIALKPQADKVGTLPRRRDAAVDSKLRPLKFTPLSMHRFHDAELSGVSSSAAATNWNISALARRALNSPRTRHEVAVSHEQLVGSCCLGPLGGVHGDRFNAGATAYGLLERHHISIQQGHTGQGITQETWHGSLPPQWPCSHQQHREEGTL